MNPLPTLNNDEITRYSRHLILGDVGMAGQQKLKGAKVLLIGAGGLGPPLGLYLAAAGVGHLGVVDHDTVDISNLQRQVVHGTSDVGKLKVISMAETIKELNPHVKVTPYPFQLTRDNAIEIFKDYDIIVDGSDNFATRYLVNDAAFFAGKPLVFGSIFTFDGQVTVLDPAAGGPCYRCLYAEPPPAALVPNCSEVGVIGVLPGVVGLLMGTEVIKRILGYGTSLVGRLLVFNATHMRFKEARIKKLDDCALCGSHPTITELVDYEAFCAVNLPGVSNEPVSKGPDVEISPSQLKAALEKDPQAVLVDVREPHEWDIARIQGAKLMPLKSLEDHLGQLPKDQDIYLYCYKGIRSQKAIDTLRQHGYSRLYNLAGGIDAWAVEIDPAMARY